MIQMITLVPAELMIGLELLANERGVSRAEIVRAALRGYLDGLGVARNKSLCSPCGGNGVRPIRAGGHTVGTKTCTACEGSGQT